MELTLNEIQFVKRLVLKSLNATSDKSDYVFISKIDSKLNEESKKICQNTGVKITPEYLTEKGFILFPWGYTKHEILIRTNHRNSFWIELGNGKQIILDTPEKLQDFFKLAGCPVF